MDCRKILACMLAAFLMLSIMPGTAFAADGDGDGYDDHDFGKLRAFLEQPSGVSGQTNGQRINAAYDPDDPATWTGVEWNGDSPKRVVTIDNENSKWHGRSLAGALDVSGFTALKKLCCASNAITSVGVGGDTALESLVCENNDLAALDISSNTALVELYCNSNQLTALDVSANTALTKLLCGNNQIASLDVSQNAALDLLSCVNNQLTSLIVSNPALTYFRCDENQLSVLDLSASTALEYINCDENLLSGLDLSINTALTYLSCQNNHLTSIRANMFGKAISLSASGDGYVDLLAYTQVGQAGAVPKSGAAFIDWTESGAQVSVETTCNIIPGERDYDLVAHFSGSEPPPVLTLAMSPPDGHIYTGGRVTITPSISDGTWAFDAAYLSRSGNVFTGLKAGTVRVSYTAAQQTAHADIVITQSQLPSTGQDFTPVIFLLVLSAVAVGLSLVIVCCRRRKHAGAKG